MIADDFLLIHVLGVWSSLGLDKKGYKFDCSNPHHQQAETGTIFFQK